MKNTESGEDKATRQCWECLKRRLVCDHTLPHCKKCQKVACALSASGTVLNNDRPVRSVQDTMNKNRCSG
jgi:hypothetical protein